MLLDFNIDKSICATGYLIERAGGCEDMFMLLKKVYFADRSALIGWGQSITGDRLASLEKGPVVSGIYNLLKGAGTQERLIKWNDFIERQGSPSKDPELRSSLRKREECVGELAKGDLCHPRKCSKLAAQTLPRVARSRQKFNPD
jgi:hypothetical protein